MIRATSEQGYNDVIKIAADEGRTPLVKHAEDELNVYPLHYSTDCCALRAHVEVVRAIVSHADANIDINAIEDLLSTRCCTTP